MARRPRTLDVDGLPRRAGAGVDFQFRVAIGRASCSAVTLMVGII